MNEILFKEVTGKDKEGRFFLVVKDMRRKEAVIDKSSQKKQSVWKIFQETIQLNLVYRHCFPVLVLLVINWKTIPPGSLQIWIFCASSPGSGQLLFLKIPVGYSFLKTCHKTGDLSLAG